MNALSDTIREESTAMIDQLTALGVQPVLLTGDHENAAKSIADQLHISEVHAGCLPEDKLNWIADYQKKEEAVCMIGDGVNDAPALKRADVRNCRGGVEVTLQWMQRILRWYIIPDRCRLLSILHCC